MIDNWHAMKRAILRFVNLERFGLNFSNFSFAIRVNLLHPHPSWFRFGLLLPPVFFSNLAKYYFKISFNFKMILNVIKNTSAKLLDNA